MSREMMFGEYKRHMTPIIGQSRKKYHDLCIRKFESGEWKPWADRDRSLREFAKELGPLPTPTQWKWASFFYEICHGIMSVRKIEMLCDFELFFRKTGVDKKWKPSKGPSVKERYLYAAVCAILNRSEDTEATIQERIKRIWGKQIESTHFVGIFMRWDFLMDNDPARYRHMQKWAEGMMDTHRDKWRLDSDHKGFGL